MGISHINIDHSLHSNTLYHHSMTHHINLHHHRGITQTLTHLLVLSIWARQISTHNTNALPMPANNTHN